LALFAEKRSEAATQITRIVS